MTTLKQKLPRIPSPIREMIVENIDDARWKTFGNPYDSDDGLMTAFEWNNPKHIKDLSFWSAVDLEILEMP